jgi:hypothetical protein
MRHWIRCDPDYRNRLPPGRVTDKWVGRDVAGRSTGPEYIPWFQEIVARKTAISRGFKPSYQGAFQNFGAKQVHPRVVTYLARVARRTRSESEGISRPARWICREDGVS